MKGSISRSHYHEFGLIDRVSAWQIWSRGSLSTGFLTSAMVTSSHRTQPVQNKKHTRYVLFNPPRRDVWFRAADVTSPPERLRPPVQGSTWESNALCRSTPKERKIVTATLIKKYMLINTYYKLAKWTKLKPIFVPASNHVEAMWTANIVVQAAFLNVYNVPLLITVNIDKILRDHLCRQLTMRRPRVT